MESAAVVAVAAVAVPVLVGATVGYYIYYPEAFQNMTDTVKNSFQNWCKVASQSSVVKSLLQKQEILQ